MGNQVIPYEQRQNGLSINNQADNLIVSLYATYIGISLEVKAYIAKALYYINKIAPIILAADLINFAIGVVRWLGLTQNEEEEVIEWLLNVYSTI